MPPEQEPIRGRGAAGNPANRFDVLHYERDPDTPADEASAPATRFLRDATRSILVTNDSPDVGFEVSINPYRGCEHGCPYCYARPTHEYLGFSAGLDFETRILVKENAPELLRRELAEHHAAAVFLSVTTLDGSLARVMEPRASQPAGRLAAVAELARAGVPVGVLVAPVIPGLTDHELPAIVEAAAAAGARHAGYVLLRLPLGVADLFERWLEQHFPDRKEKVLGRIRSLRGGRLNDPRFGSRMRGEGVLAETIRQMFALACRKAGIMGRGPELSAAAFRRPGGTQRLLFE